MKSGFHVARLLAVLVRDVIVCEALAGPGGPRFAFCVQYYAPEMLTQTTNIGVGSCRTISSKQCAMNGMMCIIISGRISRISRISSSTIVNIITASTTSSATIIISSTTSKTTSSSSIVGTLKECILKSLVIGKELGLYYYYNYCWCCCWCCC